MEMKKTTRRGRKLKQGHKYEIWWIDTSDANGWHNEKGIIEKAKEIKILNKTVGFYVLQAENYCVFAMSYCPVENFNPWGYLKFIPTLTIKKIIEL